MKIGIYGGAFNPLHAEHMNIARHALEEGLDKIVFVPSHLPPHKTCSVDFDARVEMLQCAIADCADMEVCPIEGMSDTTHYTYRTLPMLKKWYGDIVFIIGGDSMIAFDHWMHPEEIIRICPIWVYSRGDQTQQLQQAVDKWRARGADIRICSYCPRQISSTRIRYGLSLGITDDVEPSVLPYIRENGLYQDYAAMAATLRTMIAELTYEHACSVAMYGLYLNEKCNLGLDNDKVFVACLLHDCGKQWAKTCTDTAIVPANAIGTPVAHQFAGAWLAEQTFGITDAEILQAIRRHCSAHPDMRTLDKVVYCADKLELRRDYDGVDELRRAIEHDFEEGYRLVLRHACRYVTENNQTLYPLTIQALQQI